MPLIESVQLRAKQYVARVRVEKHETLRVGDLLPYHGGVRYRVLGCMRFLGGGLGKWRLEGGVEVRTIETIVAVHEAGDATSAEALAGRDRLRKKRKP